MRNRKSQAFSLLELLAVVTILGVIAVVVIPRIAVSRRAALESAVKANCDTFNKAIERYYFDYGEYPLGNNTQKLVDAGFSSQDNVDDAIANMLAWSEVGGTVEYVDFRYTVSLD